jgi:hypothetical protein
MPFFEIPPLDYSKGAGPQLFRCDPAPQIVMPHSAPPPSKAGITLSDR